MVEPDRMLAQIVKIISIHPIKDADKIELARVLGWDVVVKKGDFAVGDLGIYFTIGSILDINNPNTSFLEGKVLKTKKIRGVLSQGLLGPISWLSLDQDLNVETFKEDDDVTSLLSVKKWVPTEEQDLYKDDKDDDDMCRAPFPAIIPKTDEDRVQNMTKQLPELSGSHIVITQKYDGTSTTFMTLNGKFMICSRNYLILKEKPFSASYYEIARKYNLENNMTQLNKNIAIQGETIGPKINGNRHKVSAIDFYVFNIFDIDTLSYLPHDEVESICITLGLKTVPIVYKGEMKDEWLNVGYFLDLADKQKYDTGPPCEGIVIKARRESINDTNIKDNRHPYSKFSFKAISNKYLLKYNL